MNKKPWLAALLNFFTFGGGYVYVGGKKKGFGWALLLAWITVRIGEVGIFLTHITGQVLHRWIFLFCGLVVFMITFAVDGYKEAKMMNM